MVWRYLRYTFFVPTWKIFPPGRQNGLHAFLLLIIFIYHTTLMTDHLDDMYTTPGIRYVGLSGCAT
jgi:hypothetical protein